MAEFHFKYMTNSNSVTIDDFNVHTKTGPFIKKDFPFQNIIHFYYTQQNTYHQIFFIYTDEKGKRKKTALFATPGEPGIQQLNHYLLEKIPAKALNHLPEKEAFAAMQVANPKKMAAVILLVMLTVILGVVLFPGLRHNFDHGFSKVNVADLISGRDIGTRNIEVEGRLLDYGIEETTTTTHNGSTTVSHSTFVPIVDENWKEGDPVKVVIKFSELTDSQYSLLLDNKDFKGVIRNIWWEGISSKQVNYFKEHYSLNIPDKPLLIEFTDKEHNDAYALWVFAGVEGLVLLLVFIAWMKTR